MPAPTLVFKPLDGAVGCDYRQSTNQLFVVEFDGDIDVINLSNNSHQFFGHGYQNLEDIKISHDGLHAYVTERQGNLLKVDMSNPDKAHAKLISSGMTAPQQIFLDEAHNAAYVVEYATPGRILRINLSGGPPATNHTPVAHGLQNAVGLVLSADRKFAYVTEQTGGHLSRIQLNNNHKTYLVSGLTAPFFLKWLGSGDHTLLTTERDPANKVVLIDLTHTPAHHTAIANVAFRPSSVCVVGGDEVYVSCDQEVEKFSLTGFGPSSPVLMGIGFVPADHIIGGYATTDPTYFFQVVDAPFGGSLPLMINFDAARTMGAAHYRIVVDGAELPVVQYSDYIWNGTHFVLQNNPVVPGTYYDVHAAGQLWYNPYLGAFVYSPKLTNGLHTIAIRLFNAAHAEIGHITDPHRSVEVMIDNGWPMAVIDKIFHNGVEVPVCAVEHLGVDKWTFEISARDPEKHLKSWGLSVTWGNNQSAAIASGAYTHVPSKQWEGLPPDPNVVPTPPWKAAVAGDPTSTNCAHSFYLGVWDRVIDGWNWLHYADYYKSITIIP